VEEGRFYDRRGRGRGSKGDVPPRRMSFSRGLRKMRGWLKSILIFGFIIAIVVLFFYLLYRIEQEDKFQTELNRTEQVGKYLACGCGCCEGANATEQCLYRSMNETLEPMMRNDIALRSNPGYCARFGCSIGTLFKYCD
jgi:hypothetical protein